MIYNIALFLLVLFGEFDFLFVLFILAADGFRN